MMICASRIWPIISSKSSLYKNIWSLQFPNSVSPYMALSGTQNIGVYHKFSKLSTLQHQLSHSVPKPTQPNTHGIETWTTATVSYKSSCPNSVRCAHSDCIYRVQVRWNVRLRKRREHIQSKHTSSSHFAATPTGVRPGFSRTFSPHFTIWCNSVT